MLISYLLEVVFQQIFFTKNDHQVYNKVTKQLIQRVISDLSITCVASLCQDTNSSLSNLDPDSDPNPDYKSQFKSMACGSQDLATLRCSCTEENDKFCKFSVQKAENSIDQIKRLMDIKSNKQQDIFKVNKTAESGDTMNEIGIGKSMSELNTEATKDVDILISGVSPMSGLDKEKGSHTAEIMKNPCSQKEETNTNGPSFPMPKYFYDNEQSREKIRGREESRHGIFHHRSGSYSQSRSSRVSSPKMSKKHKKHKKHKHKHQKKHKHEHRHKYDDGREKSKRKHRERSKSREHYTRESRDSVANHKKYKRDSY